MKNIFPLILTLLLLGTTSINVHSAIPQSSNNNWILIEKIDKPNQHGEIWLKNNILNINQFKNIKLKNQEILGQVNNYRTGWVKLVNPHKGELIFKLNFYCDLGLIQEVGTYHNMQYEDSIKDYAEQVIPDTYIETIFESVCTN